MADDSEPSYREKAREIYEQRSADRRQNLPEDPEAIIEELRIHEIELELQNDDLKQARDDAELARDHYSTLFDTAPVAFFLVDPDGIIEQANFRAGELFDVSRSRLVGRPIHELIVRGDRWSVDEVLNRTRTEQAPKPPTLGVNAPGRGDRYVELRAARWRRDGAPTDSGFLVSLVDVTARRELAEEQQRAVTYYRRLLREMNHRVKNNLMVLSSIIDLERNRSGDGDTLERVSQRVRNVSRVHTALYHGSADVDVVDVGASMRHFVQEFSESLAPHVHLGFRPPGEEVFVESRRALALSLVANELLTNAVQHAFPDGRSGKIEVALSTGRGELRLDISDNGVGMGRRNGIAAEDERESDGVGTQLVMQLLEELGGTWDISRDEGTTHTIRVPVRSPRADRRAEHA
jgi:PAS domain S-box-containing protein